MRGIASQLERSHSTWLRSFGFTYARMAHSQPKNFFRVQLAMYQERKLNPRQPDMPFQFALVLLYRLFNCGDVLAVIQPSQNSDYDKLFDLFPAASESCV